MLRAANARRGHVNVSSMKHDGGKVLEAGEDTCAATHASMAAATDSGADIFTGECPELTARVLL